MGLLDSVDKIILVVIIGSICVGFWESSSVLGEATEVLDQAIEAPTTFAPGLVIFVISLDTWTPGIPIDSLPWLLQWLSIPYFFAGGEYLPHFSLWTALFALVISAVVTFIAVHAGLQFKWWGLILAIFVFCASWWLWHLVTWIGIGWGADMMGLGSAVAYEVWYNAVTATRGEIIQYTFFATIPLSVFLLYRKVGTHLV